MYEFVIQFNFNLLFSNNYPSILSVTVILISTSFSTFNRLRFSHPHSIFQLELVAPIWSTAIDRARLQSRITPRLGSNCLASPVPIKGHIILRDKQITRHIPTTISSAGILSLSSSHNGEWGKKLLLLLLLLGGYGALPLRALCVRGLFNSIFHTCEN